MTEKKYIRITIGFVCLILLLHTIGFFYPKNITWGFHFTGFLVPSGFIIFFVLTLAMTFHILKRGVPQIINNAGKYMTLHPVYFLISSIGIFIGCGIILRVATPLLGDGLFLVKNFADTLMNIDSIYPRNEPLATFYYFSFMTLLQVITFQDFMNAFLIADLLLGVIFMVCVFYTLNELISDSTERLLAFIFITTLPYMQLFLGYIETYAAILTMISLFFLATTLCLKGKLSFIFVPTTALIMILTHYLAILLLPALLYLTITVSKKEGWKPVLKGYLLSLLTFVLLLFLTNFNLSQFNENVPYSHFLPLSLSNEPIEANSEVYTLFSLYHIIDLLNFLILLGIPSLFLIFLSIYKKSTSINLSREIKLFIIGVIPPLVLLLVIKFDIGAAKDWDVFAPYTLILAYLALTLFFPLASEEKRKIFMIITAISLMHSLTFFILNSSTEASLKRNEAFFDKKTLSNFGFYSSSLGLSIYHHQMKNNSEVIKVWEGYIQNYPEDGRGYINLITNLKNFGTDSLYRIEQTYLRWLKNVPDDSIAAFNYSRFSLDLGNISFSENRLEEARNYYLKAILFDKEYERAYNNLGSVFAQQGKLDTAQVLFNRAIQIDSNYAEAHYNLAMLYVDMKNRKSAIRHYKKAAELGNTLAIEKLKEMKVR